MTCITMAELIRVGQWIDGREVICPAPLDYVHRDYRKIDGHLIAGNWSLAHWAYGPGKGWAIVRVWRSKPQNVYEGRNEETNRSVYRKVPAIEEVVTTDVGRSGSLRRPADTAPAARTQAT